MLDFLFERNEQGRIINNISLDGTADTKNEYIEPLSSSYNSVRIMQCIAKDNSF